MVDLIVSVICVFNDLDPASFKDDSLIMSGPATVLLPY